MQVTYLGVTRPPDLLIANTIQISIHSDSVSSSTSSLSTDVDEKTNDLDELLIRTSSTIFFVRVQGESMTEAGVFHDDILVVDRSLTARHKDIVIARVDGEMTIKCLEANTDVIHRPKNKAYSASDANKESKLEITGVVTHVIRSKNANSEH